MKTRGILMASLIVVCLASTQMTLQAEQKPQAQQKPMFKHVNVSSALERTTAIEAWDQQDFSWFSMGGATKIQRLVFLEATGFVGRDSVGVFTTLPSFTGAYTRAGSISLKLNVSVQQVTAFRPVLAPGYLAPATNTGITFYLTFQQ